MDDVVAVVVAIDVVAVVDEVVAGDIVIIAGLTALSFLGPYLYLGYPNLKGITVGIIIMIIPLALITGAAGSGMGKAILYLFKRKQALKMIKNRLKQQKNRKNTKR